MGRQALSGDAVSPLRVTARYHRLGRRLLQWEAVSLLSADRCLLSAELEEIAMSNPMPPQPVPPKPTPDPYKTPVGKDPKTPPDA